MPVNTRAMIIGASLWWFGAAVAGPGPTPPPVPADPELLEFLASFETGTGQWPELKEALAKPTPTPTPAPRPPKEDAQR